jgi:tetratricopeptide (TPR) repeat protein
MTDEEHLDDWPSDDEATEVIRAYERDSKLKPLDAQTHFDFGVAFMELGTGLEGHAIEAFKEAARLRPSWPAAHSQLGLAYASANRREEAVESYKQALRLKLEDTDTLAALAHASLLLGRFDESEQAALKMVEASPLDSGPHFVLGVAQLLQGRYVEADESLRRAVSLEPDLAEACYGIGIAAVALGNDSVALLQHDRLMELDRRLAGKLIGQHQRGSFTPKEVIGCLFETATDG